MGINSSLKSITVKIEKKMVYAKKMYVSLPGLNAPFDPIASREAGKGHMKVVILNSSDLNNLAKCLKGDKFKGTTIE